MAYSKTTWVDRAVSTPNKYTKTLETAGSVTLVPDPTVITQAGTAVTAAVMNNIEAGLEAVDKASVGSIIYANNNLGGW